MDCDTRNISTNSTESSKNKTQGVTNLYKNHIESFIILTGGFVLLFVTLGMVQSFGVLYSELLDHFQSSKGEMGWVASLSSGLMLAFGPVSGVLQQKFGCRVIAITGCLISACGMLGSAFVSSFYLLYITYGIVCGIGFSLSHQAANVMIPIHFDKRRSLAMAIASSGGSVGTITTPLLTSWWITENSWHGTFILLSCLPVQAVVFAAFFTTKDQDIVDNLNSNKKSTSCTEKVKMLFKNASFNLFVTSGFFVAMGYFIPYILISDFAKERGIRGNDAALLITTAGVSGLLGRIVIGLVADLPIINRCALNGLVLIVGGISTVGCPYINEFTLFIVYAAFVGVFTGTFAFLQSVIAADICGKQQLGMAFGFLVFFQGFAVMIGPPIAGWISDSTGRYNEAFYYGGALFILGGILSLLIPLHEHFYKNRKRGKYDIGRRCS